MGIMLTFSYSVTEEDGRLLALMLFLFAISKGEASRIGVGRGGVTEMSLPYLSGGAVLHGRVRLFDLSLMPHPVLNPFSAAQIELLQLLVQIASENNLGEGVIVKIKFNIIASLYDYNPNLATYMKVRAAKRSIPGLNPWVRGGYLVS